MPRIFDNLKPSSSLLPALQETMKRASRADFCVGYFNLRGWRGLAPYADNWPEGSRACRLLIGMHSSPHDELREAFSLREAAPGVDNQVAHRRKVQLAEELRDQLTIGAPTNSDERTLQKLAVQLRSKKVVVKLFLRHPLHAKLYLLFRDDPDNPVVGYVGSSNLTLAGLRRQGELNVDVLDHDATTKLQAWFDARWNDQFSVDITDELVQIIEASWAREQLVPPYHVYLKMAYHLSREAREGLTAFKIPAVFGNKLFEFQSAAVKIAARYVTTRNGVLIGDVVGLGKTLMASALVRILQEGFDLETLIICPPNLTSMWENYSYRYRLGARVLSLGQVITKLPKLPRYRLVVIDESHNLRNREGKRYRAVQEYIHANDSKCILLSATPYNKSYLDLSSQLRLFVEDDKDIGVRPERLMRELGEVAFSKQHQASPRTLAAFDHSDHPDDWRDLMRLFLVRRTRSFIQDHYAETDPETGRRFLVFEDGTRSYFPVRVPKTVQFVVDESDPNDQYAALYSQRIVDTVNDLELPRYGLANYLARDPSPPTTEAEDQQIQDLSRAGKRLMGFSRTNLFKRLESSGFAFMQSVESHVLRNYVFLHAIRKNLPIPLGPQNAEMLNTLIEDEDRQWDQAFVDYSQEEETDNRGATRALADRAGQIYADYQAHYANRFKWLRADLFQDSLETDLQADADALLGIVQAHGDWDPARDTKLEALHALLTETYADEKVLVFSQFADTVRYLEAQLTRRGVEALAGVTGDSGDPTELVSRFSPQSNPLPNMSPPGEELRVLVTTDLLSEGQNLQDCHVVVNYDLPWAIIRIIQRAGRVDRIGQKAERILCHSFLPAEGVERIIDLRKRVGERLKENAEVVGADETFFEGEDEERAFVDLYHEHAGTLDGDPDGEVDLASHAYQIWRDAVADDRRLASEVEKLPSLVVSSRDHSPRLPDRPEGVLVFLRTADDNDALAYVDRDGKSITESQFEILRLAECPPDTPARPHHESHHELVAKGIRHIAREEKRIGGQLGRPVGARFRTYNRLKQYADAIRGQIFEEPLRKAIGQIYRYPLRQAAVDNLNRLLRSGADDQQLTNLVVTLHQEDRLCLTDDRDNEPREPQIICSLGMFSSGADG